MGRPEKRRLTREDWVRGALEILRERGVEGVKVLELAKQVGATTGSFYWHFEGMKDLLECLLDYWERELTNSIRDAVLAYRGSPIRRIHYLMIQVIERDAAVYDHAMSVWAGKYPAAQEVYDRTIQRRIDFVSWLFKEAGFTKKAAKLRGRLLVAYLMGESATNLKADRNWKSTIKGMHRLMTSVSDLTS